MQAFDIHPEDRRFEVHAGLRHAQVYELLKQSDVFVSVTLW